MGVCKKIKRKDDQERNVKKYPRKKEGRVLEMTRQSMKRKISNDL